MAKYSFDESQTIDANLESFFEHLERADAEYAGILRRELPEVVAGRQTRSKFHASLTALLDAASRANGKHAEHRRTACAVFEVENHAAFPTGCRRCRCQRNRHRHWPKCTSFRRCGE